MKGIKDTQATIQNVNIKLDPVVKSSAEGVLSGMGLSMSAYVGMCLRQLAQDRRIPFAQTVDPDFWITETRVSAAKAHIDSGAFEAAWSLFVKVRDEFWKAHKDAGTSALNASIAQSDDLEFLTLWPLLNLLSEEDNRADLGSIGKVVAYGKQRPGTVRDKKALMEPYPNGHLAVPLIDSFANAIEAVADATIGAIDAALESEACLRDAIDGNPSELTDEEKAAALDAIIFLVLDVADDHKTNLSMRFVGSGGQAKLEEVFACLRLAKQYQEWVSKADERVRKLRDDFERHKERMRQA